MNSKNKQADILQALNWRYATKIFDPNKKVDEEIIHTILESARLSPSANGLEPWRFFLIQDKQIRSQLYEASKQDKVRDASHLVVIAYRTDMDENIINERLERTAKIQNQTIESLAEYRKSLEKTIAQKKTDGTMTEWTRAQSYIPLGIMILTASLLGVDNGPMEGFDIKKVNEILDLEAQNLTAVTMLALGYRGEDPYSLRKKIRRDKKEVIKII